GECGTRQYRAPEMHTNNYYSYPADVFAFGVTVHRMAGGRLPEQGSIFPLSSVDVKEVVTVLMHHFAEMRLRMDEASHHPFFQGSTLDHPKLETKRPLVDDDDDTAIGDDHKDKRIRHDSNADNKNAFKENVQGHIQEHMQQRISFSLLPIGSGLSLQDVQDTTTTPAATAPVTSTAKDNNMRLFT
ncbi:hypothetical protein EC991_010731, partial [Linnemannia zychae]